ncbi:putative F-box-like domain superfamily protein [Arabidopsis thaliana]
MNNLKSNLLDTEHGDKVAEQKNLASMDCLPDNLLVQILYFLPTKEAISTSLFFFFFENNVKLYSKKK